MSRRHLRCDGAQWMCQNKAQRWDAVGPVQQSPEKGNFTLPEYTFSYS